MSKSRARTEAALAEGGETKTLGISSLGTRREAGGSPVSSGARTLLPPGSFSNPQGARVRTRAPGDVPSASLHPACLCLSP